MDETGMTPRITVDDHVDRHIVITALTIMGEDLTSTRDVIGIDDLTFLVDMTSRICDLLITLRAECAAEICSCPPPASSLERI